MNVLTGETFWELPADVPIPSYDGTEAGETGSRVESNNAPSLDGVAVGALVPVDAAVWTPSSASHVFKPTAGVRMINCVMCEERGATRQCLQCDDAYCDRCFTWSHSKGQQQSHRYLALAGADPMCVECEARYGIRQCVECGDNFCLPCHAETHEKGNRALHSWTYIGFAHPAV